MNWLYKCTACGGTTVRFYLSEELYIYRVCNLCWDILSVHDRVLKGSFKPISRRSAEILVIKGYL